MFKELVLLAFIGLVLAFYISDIYYVYQQFRNSNKFTKGTLFIPEELPFFDGVQTPLLYLAIIGNVFNVTDGWRHYGPGQKYHFFVGKDATRNFVTGQFEDMHASSSIDDLSQKDLLQVNKWLKFYKKEYKHVGKLIGQYYDELGKLTKYGRTIRKRIREAEEAEQYRESEKLVFPPCNVECDSEKGSRVWCTTRSGGIERMWEGKPRQYYDVEAKSFRCVCVRTDDDMLNHMKLYPDCDRNSDSCYVKS